MGGGQGKRGRGGGTLTFACYRGSDYFLRVQNFEFRFFLCVEVLSTICMGMPFRTGIFFLGGGGCQFEKCRFYGASFI